MKCVSGDQALDRAAHGGGAEEHRFFLAARVKQAVGEDVPALEIGAELDFVDRQERALDVERHRLDGAHVVARMCRHDALFTGDQRNLGRALDAHDLVVDLACQQPQRQPDHAGAVRQHPLDGEMGLARVGGAEHGRDPVLAGRYFGAVGWASLHGGITVKTPLGAGRIPSLWVAVEGLWISAACKGTWPERIVPESLTALVVSIRSRTIYRSFRFMTI